MTGEDRAAALRANIALYATLDERRYVNGAPHLKHESVAAIYRELVAQAVARTGLNPKEISVLDLGAGSGLGSIAWLALGVNLTAVDSSEPMLAAFAQRAASTGSRVTTIVSDVDDYLTSSKDRFDIVTHVSMLHHVPDYLGLLRLSTAHVRPGGGLLTFQDPLRYDQMPIHERVIDRGSYFVWRLAQGNYRRGLRTRWRRIRGVYSPTETVDFDEYHVVRNGVDSSAIIEQLRATFSDVSLVKYWSTYSAALQSMGRRLGLRSSFGILASGRNAT